MSETLGAANRLIEREGTAVEVIDEYNQYTGEGGYGSPTYDRRYFVRATTTAVMNRPSEYSREYLTVGTSLEGTVLAFFASAGPDGEPVIRETGGADVPEDEQLSGGVDPSQDYYGPSHLHDMANGGYFDVINATREGSGVRRVQGDLRDGAIDTEPRPE